MGTQRGAAPVAAPVDAEADADGDSEMGEGDEDAVVWQVGMLFKRLKRGKWWGATVTKVYADGETIQYKWHPVHTGKPEKWKPNPAAYQLVE